MTQLLLIAALGTAAVAGASLASIAQPACHWSSLSAIALKTRLAMLKAVAPSRRRAWAASLGLASLLSAGALAAYAAQPSAPERLAAQAAGVVGSGDQLALRVVEDSRERTVKPGEVYADGWKLDALTPATATLVKDGERREVGLNPTGQLPAAAPAAPPSQVRVVLSDAELLEKAARQLRWDGQTLLPGLNLEETKRYYVLRMKGLDQASATPPPGPPPPPGGPMVARELTGQMVLDALGSDALEYSGLLARQDQANYDLAVAAFQRFGPIEVARPIGPEANEKLRAEYPGARWSIRTGDPSTMVMAMPAPLSAYPIQTGARP